MANSISGSINLQKCKGARRIIAGGAKGIFIPTEDNPTIYVGENCVMLNIRVVESHKTFTQKDGTVKEYSHFVAVAFGSKKAKDDFEAKFGEETVKEFTPILGNLSEYKAAPAPEASYEEVEVKDDNGEEPFPF